MKFTNNEISVIHEYMTAGKFIITNNKFTKELLALDCKLSCDKCYFKTQCIVGGSPNEVTATANKLREIIPEYFL